MGAAVDVGSNSVHLLVARIIDGGLESLRDESELIGLGDVVDAEGLITSTAEEQLIGVLTKYRDTAREIGAEKVTFIGTDPFRQAENAFAVSQRIERATGVPIHVLTKREEGELTFMGVTGGRGLTDEVVVVDIGGGSTEVILFRPLTGLHVTGLETGSNRLTREHVKHDPPTKAEITRLRQVARELVEELPADQPARGIFVGGTATNVVKLQPLHEDSFEDLYTIIRSVPAATLAERYTLRLRRAGQLAGGAAIAEALLDRFGLSSADVSDASLRDGAILAAAGAAR